MKLFNQYIITKLNQSAPQLNSAIFTTAFVLLFHFVVFSLLYPINQYLFIENGEWVFIVWLFICLLITAVTFSYKPKNPRLTKIFLYLTYFVQVYYQLYVSLILYLVLEQKREVNYWDIACFLYLLWEIIIYFVLFFYPPKILNNPWGKNLSLLYIIGIDVVATFWLMNIKLQPIYITILILTLNQIIDRILAKRIKNI